MYKIKVNDHYHFDLSEQHGEFFSGEQAITPDIRELKPGVFHFIYRYKSYQAEITASDRAAGTVTVRVNGNLYQVAVEDPYETLLKQLGMNRGSGDRKTEVKAPMPGLVLKLAVEEGQEIEKGQNLLILEAMKMENILKAGAAGVIRRIAVQHGDKVEKNQLLIELEQKKEP